MPFADPVFLPEPGDTEGGTMAVWALDFDGVVCDSSLETGLRAWEVLQRFRHGLPEEPSATVMERWQELRPILEKGWHSVVVMEAAYAGLRFAEASKQWERLQEEFLRRHRVEKDEVNQLHEGRRDWWIAHHPEQWVAQNPLYPGMAEAVGQLRQRHRVFIVTTKALRFTLLLNQAYRLGFQPEEVFALESGRPKEETVAELARLPEAAGGTHFVEDRLPTLRRFLARADLDAIRLYLATWGYNAPEEHEEARRTRIRVVGLGEFSRLAAL